MCLNNIDGSEFEKQKKTVVNLSSWGLKLSDMHQFKDLFNHKCEIVINISFTDLCKSSIIYFLGSPLNADFEYLNRIFRLNTFAAQNKEIKGYTTGISFRNYQNLNFDKTGGALLMRDSFNISPERWDDSPKTPTDGDLNRFVDGLKLFQKKHVYIFFSPERVKYKNIKKLNSIIKLKHLINHHYTNVQFFNNYLEDFHDSLFVDCTHLNNIGAKKYTQIILKQMQLKNK